MTEHMTKTTSGSSSRTSTPFSAPCSSRPRPARTRTCTGSSAGILHRFPTARGRTRRRSPSSNHRGHPRDLSCCPTRSLTPETALDRDPQAPALPLRPRPPRPRHSRAPRRLPSRNRHRRLPRRRPRLRTLHRTPLPGLRPRARHQRPTPTPAPSASARSATTWPSSPATTPTSPSKPSPAAAATAASSPPHPSPAATPQVLQGPMVRFDQLRTYRGYAADDRQEVHQHLRPDPAARRARPVGGHLPRLVRPRPRPRAPPSPARSAT
jgi:hypothetical protein